ncbi:MAG: D-glycero-beta-D-manno-heptose 1,7-bisphosphate 7-phosphatase [Thermodesulfobacteriota bacterium]
MSGGGGGDGGGGAVFLDRDGTINEDSGYISDPDDLKLLPGAAGAIKRLNDAGVPVIVITNQSGVGRGYYTEDDVRAVNRRMTELLGLEGAEVDGIYYCPHRPEDDCGCRKPATGLLDAAARERGVELARSFMVGDKASDVGAAKAAGVKSVFVLTGHGRAERDRLEEKGPAPDFVAEDIGEAVGWIMAGIK